MKQASRLLSLLVVTAAFVLLAGAACSSKKTPPARAWQPGAFRDTSPNIQAYSWPAGIEPGTISASDSDITTAPSSMALFMTVSNSKGSDVQLKLPAGLVFSPSPAEYQYMMLLQDWSFTIPAGASDDTLVLSTYCCNQDSTPPDDEASYTVVGTEWDSETQELLDTLAVKSPVADTNADNVQDALYEITDGSGLNDSTRAVLKQLP